jgi:hypothetical protein
VANLARRGWIGCWHDHLNLFKMACDIFGFRGAGVNRMISVSWFNRCVSTKTPASTSDPFAVVGALAGPHDSAYGTEPTLFDVRCLVAIGEQSGYDADAIKSQRISSMHTFICTTAEPIAMAFLRGKILDLRLLSEITPRCHGLTFSTTISEQPALGR